MHGSSTLDNGMDDGPVHMRHSRASAQSDASDSTDGGVKMTDEDWQNVRLDPVSLSFCRGP